MYKLQGENPEGERKNVCKMTRALSKVHPVAEIAKKPTIPRPSVIPNIPKAEDDNIVIPAPQSKINNCLDEYD